MIDDDFSPNRIHLRALGHLLVIAQNAPLLPSIREGELYNRVYERELTSERREWLNELAAHGLVKIAQNSMRVGDRLGDLPVDVCLTPAGIFYTVSRASTYGMNARTPTDNFPNDIVDAPWAIQSYFSPPEGDLAPSADSFVRFDHNETAFQEALESIDAVYDALKYDNEIGSSEPYVRDEKLDELKAIRSLLEQREGWQTRLISAGWGVLGYIATHFADRPVAYLAERAWHALQVIIGLR